MDYQSNNQSGEPNNTGEPNNNICPNGNPYNSTPVNNGDSCGNAPSDSDNPYGSPPYRNGTPYGRAPGSADPYGNAPGRTTPYGNAPGSTTPYGNAPGNTTPYGNAPGNTTPYGNAPGSTTPYGNAPADNGNPYGNRPYNNTNPYHNPYANGNPYYNGNPYGNVNADIVSPHKPKGEGMATAAMILGIISLVSLLLLRVYVPFLVGGTGIILAVLSKGSAKKMLGKARAGLICCITGLVLDIVLCVSSVYLVFALPDIMPEMMDEVNQMCEERYGMSYDEIMDEIYELWEMDR